MEWAARVRGGWKEGREITKLVMKETFHNHLWRKAGSGWGVQMPHGKLPQLHSKIRGTSILRTRIWVRRRLLRTAEQSDVRSEIWGGFLSLPCAVGTGGRLRRTTFIDDRILPLSFIMGLGDQTHNLAGSQQTSKIYRLCRTWSMKLPPCEHVRPLQPDMP